MRSIIKKQKTHVAKLDSMCFFNPKENAIIKGVFILNSLFPYFVLSLMLLTYIYSFLKKVSILRDMNGAVLAFLIYTITDQLWWLSLIVLIAAYIFAIIQTSKNVR